MSYVTFDGNDISHVRYLAVVEGIQQQHAKV